MTHGRIAKSSGNKRREKRASPLTGFTKKQGEALETRLADLEARVTSLEQRVDDASGVVPAHLYAEINLRGAKRPGPIKRVDETELFLNRDNLIHWLEEHWPQIVNPLLAAGDPSQVAAAFRPIVMAREIRPEWQQRVVGHPAKLLEFLRSEKFRRKPPKKTIADALGLHNSEARARAANRLPTRQIANAMAGVPQLKWRTSLDRCSKNPSTFRVGHNAASHYRTMFGISQD